MARVCIFGGTFDPVHRGHLAVARAALPRLKLDQLIFLPAGVPPHKQHKPRADFRHRFRMLKLATAREPRFAVSRLEASGVHYSIDSVRRIQRSLKKRDRLFFLIGMDAFLDIASWYRAEELLRQCEFVVATRPGVSLKKARAGVRLLPGIANPISATQVRAAARRGRPLGALVPSSVARYIEKHHLYR